VVCLTLAYEVCGSRGFVDSITRPGEAPIADPACAGADGPDGAWRPLGRPLGGLAKVEDGHGPDG
jgi:hypothetical protein